MERSCLGDHKKKINDNEANVVEMNRLALRNMHRKKEMVEEIIKKIVQLADFSSEKSVDVHLCTWHINVLNYIKVNLSFTGVFFFSVSVSPDDVS